MSDDPALPIASFIPLSPFHHGDTVLPVSGPSGHDQELLGFSYVAVLVNHGDTTLQLSGCQALIQTTFFCSSYYTVNTNMRT